MGKEHFLFLSNRRDREPNLELWRLMSIIKRYYIVDSDVGLFENSPCVLISLLRAEHNRWFSRWSYCRGKPYNTSCLLYKDHRKCRTIVPQSVIVKEQNTFKSGITCSLSNESFLLFHNTTKLSQTKDRSARVRAYYL